MWLGQGKWTPEAEEVALRLKAEHLAGSGAAGKRLIKQQLGDNPDLHEVFHKMAMNWEETIGELMEVVRAI
jgi:hypothetical protein